MNTAAAAAEGAASGAQTGGSDTKSVRAKEKDGKVTLFRNYSN